MALMTGHARTAFISGPLDATAGYFDEYYAQQIQAAVLEGENFVIGPVAGVDALALRYLLDHGVSPSRIIIYTAHFEYQDLARRSAFEELGVTVKMVGDVGATTRDRDAAMTHDSDYDILRYRTEAEAKFLYGDSWWPRVSNTEMNERRRRGIKSQAYKLNEGAELVSRSDDGSAAKHRTRDRIKKMLGKK